jgi:predicted nucleic acid-binding protein
VAVARFLADRSALARLTHEAVANRLRPLLEAGLVATCAVVELEVLFSTRNHDEYETVRGDRRSGYEWLPMPDEVWDRALEIQRSLSRSGRLRSTQIPDLLVAATAERHGVTVIHYDSDFDRIAEISGQPTEWVVPAGSVP